jgi:hypothetical protein
MKNYRELIIEWLKIIGLIVALYMLLAGLASFIMVFFDGLAIFE